MTAGEREALPPLPEPAEVLKDSFGASYSVFNCAQIRAYAAKAVAEARQSDKPEKSDSPKRGLDHAAGQHLSAKPCEWELQGDTDWADKHYGFYISFEANDDPSYYAAWGEGDGESFPALNEAKAWCQSEVDRWVRTYAVVAPIQPTSEEQP